MKYQVKDPQGQMHIIEGPEGATPEQVIQQAQSLIPSQQKPQGLMGKAWNALGKPEQMSRQGLGMIANMIPGAEPTGNKFRDIALNIPKVGAETLAEAAPGFIGRGALATAGAMPALRGLGKAAEVIGPGIASQAESLSGMKPGLLGKAFKDPSLIFASIPKGAREAYQTSANLAKTSPVVSETARPLQLVQKLLKQAKTGMITPDEALAGRKGIDQLWESKSITEDFKNMARKTFDSIAKMQPEIKEADIGFSRGKQAAGLRQLLPQNKFGGTSAFKTAIMAGMNAMGPMGKVGMSGMSPLAMGTGATALGAGAKAASPFVNNPRLAVVVQQLIDSLMKQNQSQTQQLMQ